ncbi:hypothetical protein EMIT0P228_50291 [Pseudomonas brassicacearum]
MRPGVLATRCDPCRRGCAGASCAGTIARSLRQGQSDSLSLLRILITTVARINNMPIHMAKTPTLLSRKLKPMASRIMPATMGTSMALNEDIEIMATALSGKDKASLVGVLPGCADVCHIALIPEANTVWEENCMGAKLCGSKACSR